MIAFILGLICLFLGITLCAIGLIFVIGKVLNWKIPFPVAILTYALGKLSRK